MLLRKQVSLSQADKLEKEHFYSSLHHLFFLRVTEAGILMRSSYTAICNLCYLLIFYLLRQITQVMMFGSGDIFMPVFKHHSNSAIKVQLLKPVVGYQK